ncbi:MAG TPA: hypothetical protein VFR66_06030 [Burkholderiales bacterium]|nr:hypothetical protein [Burkholderiales bacterium]
MTVFRPALAGDVSTIVAMMRGYYEQDGYAEAGSGARRSRSPKPTVARPG